MRGSWLRETALTNNIANADTPGYTRQEVNFESALQGAMDSGEAPTQSANSRPNPRPTEAGPNGAGVSIDQEAARLAENGLDYQALTQVVSTRNGDRALGDRDPLMGLFDAIGIAGTGLTAERIRMDVTAENLANADTTKGANGQPYQRQEVVLAQLGSPGGFSGALSGALQQTAGRSTGRRGPGHGDRRRHDARPASSTTPATPKRTRRAT